ncbi:MAG TPA: threonine/serine exporter family protein, partial [Holophagaceae bacterium]|nr:threonine/serine exporter family protein [Holophagaceae bacterium]
QSIDDQRIAFILKLGRALQAYGTPAHRFEEALEAVCRRLELEGQFFGMPTGYFASFGKGSQGRTFVQRVPTREVDLARLDDTYAVTDALLRADIDPAEASARLDGITARTPRFGGAMQVAAFALVSACFGAFLGCNARGMAAAAVLGAVLGLLGRLTERFDTLERLSLLLSALLASFGAGLLGHLAGGFPPQLAMVAGLIMLLPGLSLTIALNELATGHLVAGTSRFAGALVVLLQLVFGVVLGQKLGAFLPPAGGAPIHAAGAWVQWPALLLAPVAITVLLRGRLRDLGWLWAVGLLAYGGAQLGGHFFGPETGLGVGALLGALGSNAFSRIRRRPSLVVLLPTLYLLTPGSVGFRGFALMAQSDVYSGMDAAFRMAFLAFALVTGLLIANAALPPRRSL